MIIVVINAALLLLYLYLIIQFLVLPLLRPWGPRLRTWVPRPAQLAKHASSKLACGKHAGGATAWACGWSPRSEPAILEPAASKRHSSEVQQEHGQASGQQ